MVQEGEQTLSKIYGFDFFLFKFQEIPLTNKLIVQVKFLKHFFRNHLFSVADLNDLFQIANLHIYSPISFFIAETKFSEFSELFVRRSISHFPLIFFQKFRKIQVLNLIVSRFLIKLFRC